MMDYRLHRDDNKKRDAKHCVSKCVIPVVKLFLIHSLCTTDYAHYSFNTKSMHITAARINTRSGWSVGTCELISST